jgi:hypothetical protein
VNNREVFGHWEADTIIGKAHKGVIVTLDERISTDGHNFESGPPHDHFSKAWLRLAQ